MRTPVAAERLEADRRAMEQKVARLQAQAIKLQGKEALRLNASADIKAGDVRPGSNGAKSASWRSGVRSTTATAWQKRRPTSADSDAMPSSMRTALRRGSTKAEEAAEREFTPTVARPSFRSSVAPQPAPDERAVRQLIAAARSDHTSRAGSPTASLTGSARGRSSTAWAPDRAARDAALHFSPQRRRNPGLVAGSPPWPLHRVAIAQAVAETLSLRDDSSDVLRSRSSSLAEYQQRHCVPPQYDISYLDENDAYVDERDGSWHRRERKSRLPSVHDAEALQSLLHNGLANARYRDDGSQTHCRGGTAQPGRCARDDGSTGVQTRQPAAEPDDRRYIHSAENVLAKVFEELATVRPSHPASC